MTILLVSDVFPPRPGGSGRWLWELYRRLAGIQVHMVAGQTHGDDVFDRDAGHPIARLPLTFPNWGLLHGAAIRQYVQRFADLRRIVAEVQPETLHCAKCLPEGLLATFIKISKRIPFLVYAHGEELTLAATSRELRFLTRRVLRSSSRIVANSEHTKTILERQWNIDESKIVVMHPGVDTSKFVEAPPNPELRRRLGWDGRRVVLTVGALQRRKGQDMMIRALPAIRTACADILYVIAGDALERDSLERLAHDLGVTDCVQFGGVPPDDRLVELYQQCDLFVLANRQVQWDFEGFGIVCLEAQACGKPVVVGMSGGAPETIEPSKTGEMVDCTTPDALASVVVQLLQDDERREGMGRLARKRVEERFDWHILSRQATALFADVVSARQ